MALYTKPDRPFWATIVLIFLGAIALRFWGLSRFNVLVFDEVYYAKFASAFLRGEQVFTGHPPLTTYIHAIGIWLATHFTWGDQIIRNDLTGLSLTTFSYRWLNALTGAFIPLMVAAIAYQLTQRHRYAAIAALFAAADGLILVESRYALNNVYLITFGLLGHLLVLLALHPWRTSSKNQPLNPIRTTVYLSLAGICFGGAIAIKWNGLGFLLGAWLLWGIAWMVQFLKQVKPRLGSTVLPHFLESLTQLHLGQVLWAFVLLPALTYYVSWIPYMQLDPTHNFWYWQMEIMSYHHRVGGMDVHPYCSPWYTWFFMLRPIAYFYRTGSLNTDPTIVTPVAPDAPIVSYAVYAMGNPLLWWFSSLAIILVIGRLLNFVWKWVKSFRTMPSLTENGFQRDSPIPQWAALYLVVNWAANWFLWIDVRRCTFLYHYMESGIFALLAITLLIDRWLDSPKPSVRSTGITAIFLVLLAFVFWMPLYLGLPLSDLSWMLRTWLPTWR